MNVATPGPTSNAIDALLLLQRRHEKFAKYLHKFSCLALSYDAHRRQMNMLLLAHVPVAVAIMLLAVIGGHVHSVQVSFLVSLPLLALFVFVVIVFGLQAERMWIPRGFALALFLLTLWSSVSVLYAIFTEVRMRAWYDGLLLALLAIELCITAWYWYTADMLAGIGGEASALSARLHYAGYLRSPLAHKLGTAASSNRELTRVSFLSRWRTSS